MCHFKEFVPKCPGIAVKLATKHIFKESEKISSSNLGKIIFSPKFQVKMKNEQSECIFTTLFTIGWF